ncbi:MAG: hypothetical protein ACKO96_13285, partial [Flammeovirgaceae bacterium]
CLPFINTHIYTEKVFFQQYSFVRRPQSRIENKIFIKVNKRLYNRYSNWHLLNYFLVDIFQLTV